jgi:hypothetical protein
MSKHVKSMIHRSHSVVSATTPLTQQSAPTTPHPSPIRKTYRRSATSRTVRVPNELVPRVNALIAAYREQLRDNPDSWTGR